MQLKKVSRNSTQSRADDDMGGIAEQVIDLALDSSGEEDIEEAEAGNVDEGQDECHDNCLEEGSHGDNHKSNRVVKSADVDVNVVEVEAASTARQASGTTVQPTPCTCPMRRTRSCPPFSWPCNGTTTHAGCCASCYIRM